jgi:hypothetical protein
MHPRHFDYFFSLHSPQIYYPNHRNNINGYRKHKFQSQPEGIAMSVTLKSYDDKIDDLKRKKKELEAKQAQQLFKAASYIIGGSYSPQLAACIIDDSWKSATEIKKGEWIKSSKKFQFTRPRKAKAPAKQNSKKDGQSRTAEI